MRPLCVCVGGSFRLLVRVVLGRAGRGGRGRLLGGRGGGRGRLFVPVVFGRGSVVVGRGGRCRSAFNVVPMEFECIVSVKKLVIEFCQISV